MSLNQDKYHTLATLLAEVRRDVATNQITVAEIRQRLVLLQQFFQEQIVPFVSNASREQMFCTEINKQLRLLEIDINFLAGASKPATIDTRLKIIGDRINTLIKYCEAVMGNEQ
ncbi:hypothetical protein NIES4101_43250 [Calothrix sp. NIES-4101]|nr:hypothetical protein NIES4101_43250 [Calothrix sp. NIES-4101]